MPLGPNWITPRDRLRRDRTRELLRAGLIRSGEDFNEAALIFQHADDYVDVGFAHDLALEAVTRDPETFRYRWLVAATLDRYLWYKCEPQIYGTQFKLVDGKYTIEPIDADLIDDEERIRWGAPTLAQAHERERRMNATLTGR